MCGRVIFRLLVYIHWLRVNLQWCVLIKFSAAGFKITRVSLSRSLICLLFLHEIKPCSLNHILNRPSFEFKIISGGFNFKSTS